MEIVAKNTLPTNLPVYKMIELLLVTAEKLLEETGFKKGDIDGIGISCGEPCTCKNFISGESKR